jgi:hypothetical protein
MVLRSVFATRTQLQVSVAVVALSLVLVVEDETGRNEFSRTTPPHQVVLVYVPTPVLETGVVIRSNHKLVGSVPH